MQQPNELVEMKEELQPFFEKKIKIIIIISFFFEKKITWSNWGASDSGAATSRAAASG